jgi:hypothetical protein
MGLPGKMLELGSEKLRIFNHLAMFLVQSGELGLKIFYIIPIIEADRPAVIKNRDNSPGYWGFPYKHAIL